jgi:hypothetical protein
MSGSSAWKGAREGMGKLQTIKDVLLIFLSAAFSLAVIEGFLMWRPYLQAQLPF